MLNKARIAVLVSGGGTNLEALLNAQEAGPKPTLWSGQSAAACLPFPCPGSSWGRSRLRRR